ncbi:hypothetical protein HH215_00065 [Cohnella herbarum]|uniref:AbiJ-NTD3 domain-containing protein n=2 Tax=Cohnella herbarum TaxID=2728023 RepID=A0A7Z2ZPW4_9BACL|nr:hypothetical protein HH215_00065 [Cohnella herbarum]
MDELFLMHFAFEGRLEFITFLKRIWPLKDMKSTDYRYKDAEGDIRQHMVNNSDWDESFLYFEYLKIETIPDQMFLQFMEQISHPLVRNDREEQSKCLEVVNRHLAGDGYKLQEVDSISGYPIYGAINFKSGPKGNIKNLIFSADGYKPEIVITDSLENNIEIVKNGEYCLVYDKPIPVSGLMWRDLVKWWAEREGIEDYKEAQKGLFRRLNKSLGSEPEKLLFKSYFKAFRDADGNFPALIPQVYLHYDPYTMKQLRGEIRVRRQRMDFLMLLPSNIRVVLEVDGKQHYSEGDKSSPKLYSEMVSEDRNLKLKGYEVFRFGGYELTVESGEATIIEFFAQLMRRFIA